MKKMLLGIALILFGIFGLLFVWILVPSMIFMPIPFALVGISVAVKGYQEK
jgi:hypothetical protein